MRHKKKGRVLGRSPSHRRAMLRNLVTALFLTERDELYYDDTDPLAPSKPKVRGRIVTTLAKAKEVRPLVEKCITIAKRSLPALRRAEELEPDAERNSEEWRQWRESDAYQEWNQAIAPVVAARRRIHSLLGGGKHRREKSRLGTKNEHQKLVIEILFDEIAPRFEDRPGGYTRILRLAQPRLGDAGTRAILELVGVHDRVKETEAEKPAFEDEGDSAVATETGVATGAEEPAAAAETETEAPTDEAGAEEKADAETSESEAPSVEPVAEPKQEATAEDEEKKKD